MSDFGTMIIIRRRDGAHMGDVDRLAVESAVVPLRRGGHTSSVGEPLRFRLGEAMLHSGARGLSLLLSEYWLAEAEGEDGAEPYDPAELIAAERLSVAPVVEGLRAALEGAYAIELIADHW